MRALLLLCLFGAALAAEQASLPAACVHALDNPKEFEDDPQLMHACQEQADLIQEQEQLDKFMAQPKNKRKNEFIRFGKRKNEFIRFGRSEPAEADVPQKRKNEFIRFGKRKNEFIRFGKRKNEFIRFRKDQQKRKNEFIRFRRFPEEEHGLNKRKNEFIRF
eukprot:839138_1